MSQAPDPSPRVARHPIQRIATATLVVLLLIGSAWLVVWIVRTTSRQDAALRGALSALLDGSAPAWNSGDSASRKAIWATVRRWYAKQGRRPVWIDDRAPGREATELAIVLARAPREGLDPEAYGLAAIRREIERARAASFGAAESAMSGLAELDLRLTVAFLRHARDLHDGRLPTAALDPDWLPLRDTIDAPAILKRALADRNVAKSLAALTPTDSIYTRLRAALAKYRLIETQGGWAHIPAGPVLRRGSRDRRCLALRSLLTRTGDLADSTRSAVFDTTLARALGRFQERQGLTGTGVLDAATRAALNVPVAERIRTLEMNLERARWMPRLLPGPHILVNIPEFRLRLMDAGVESLSMRAVVGQKTSPTPVFSDVMTSIDFNPTWRVPKRILVEELLPGFRRDRHYFEKHHMRVFWTASEELTEIEPGEVDWEDAEADSFHVLVVQDAGPENPLGQIKFLLPNEYDVYMHDTSAPGLFSAHARDLSHGCVRVERPFELAEYALRGTPVAVAESIATLVDSTVTRNVPMKRRLPVHAQYWTAWVDSAGAINFRPDLYGLDQRMDEAFRTGHVSDFVINPDVEWRDDAPAASPKKSVRR